MPTRNPKEQVLLVKCKEGYACLDLINFKKFLTNEITTETYIEQLKNILDELATPVK